MDIPSKKTRNTFPKSEKLCNFHRIRQLFEKGKSLKKYPIKLLYLHNYTERTSTEVVISVPKKKFKKAVSRNRIKRLIRESYRLQKQILSEKSFTIAFIYIGTEIMSYEQIYTTVGNLLKEVSSLE